MNEEYYLSYNGKTYHVLGIIGDFDKYVEGKGYINPDDNYIYIYTEKEKNDIPRFTIKDDKIKLYPLDGFMNNFEKKKMYDLSVEGIFSNTDNESLYNDDVINDMNSSTKVFVPIINEEDDPLKKIIKQAIISKKIDIARLKHTMPQSYGITNLKSALVKPTKMSITNFILWCELLGLNFVIYLNDNGTDDVNPLKNFICYRSDGNQLLDEPKDVLFDPDFNKSMDYLIQ